MCSRVKRDTLAGLTTFMVMACIIVVNPNIPELNGDPAGLPFAAALTSTCLVAGVMTIIMGLFTNRAYVIIRVVQGKGREVNWLLWVSSLAFVLSFIFPYLQAKGWV